VQSRQYRVPRPAACHEFKGHAVYRGCQWRVYRHTCKTRREKTYIVFVMLPIPVAMVWCVGLRPLFCCDCGFESRRWHEFSSPVFIMCCVYVAASVTSLSLSQGGPTLMCVCLTVCDIGTWTTRRLDAQFGLLCHIKKIFFSRYNKFWNVSTKL
jgi:hypothetical protein